MARERFKHASVFATLILVGSAVYSLASRGPLDAAHAQSGGDLIRSDFKPGELMQACDDALSQAESRYDAIAKVQDRTFENTVLAFESANADLNDVTLPLSFMKYVSPVPATNAEGSQCEQATGDLMVKTLGRRDLYQVLKDQQPRTPEERRLLTKTLEAFEANGLSLPDEQLGKVTQLFTQLNKLQTDYSNNMNNDGTTVILTADELQGVNPSYLAALKKTADGTAYIVGTKDPDYNQVMQNCPSDAARKKMLLAYSNRAGEANTQLIEQAIQTREQLASLLGFKTWADYQLSHNRMARSASEVLDFLNGLKDKLAARNRQDISQLLDYKKKALDPKATDVKSWDIPYLAYQLKKQSYALDDDKIREFFPADVVVQGMFKVYSQLLGVRFEPVPGAHSWSPDVQLYKIINQSDSRMIGYFYTDFVPRQGKYSHFASFSLINGRALPGGYNQPISAIVGNFDPPMGGKPALMNHDDVVTVFHEFGHIMHQTLTRAPYASLSGSNVAQDFVEAPSQMLENWPWQTEILNLVSGNYQDHSQTLPPDLLKQMIAARDYQQGYYYTRQLMLALLDMSYHTATGPVDSAAVYNDLYKQLIGVEPIAGGHFAASFGHLMGGYDAGYYGYLWSEVYAADMFTVFQTAGTLDAQAGARYRSTILERGNMEDSSDLLQQFLGRPSNNEAFLHKLHI